jgi:hypothetical protein
MADLRRVAKGDLWRVCGETPLVVGAVADGHPQEPTPPRVQCAHAEEELDESVKADSCSAKQPLWAVAAALKTEDNAVLDLDAELLVLDRGGAPKRCQHFLSSLDSDALLRKG